MNPIPDNNIIDNQRQIQLRYEYFLLSVILGLLALSIQAFNISDGPNSVYLIIISWVSLLISFLAGIYRLERNNMYLYVEASSFDIPEKVQVFLEAKAGQKTVYKNQHELWSASEINNTLANLQRQEYMSEKLLKFHAEHMLWAYKINKWFFLFALFSYALYKISNVVELSFLFEIILLLAVVFVIIIITCYYKKKTPKYDKNGETTNPRV